MVQASLEHEGNRAILNFTTHFGEHLTVECFKENDESFRLGGTAINEVAVCEAVVLDVRSCLLARIFKNEREYFDTTNVLVIDFVPSMDNRHCYATEFYDLDLDQSPKWLLTKRPLNNPNYLFVNVDVLDGGGNVVKRYRVSPFTGNFRIV